MSRSRESAAGRALEAVRHRRHRLHPTLLLEDAAPSPAAAEVIVTMFTLLSDRAFTGQVAAAAVMSASAHCRLTRSHCCCRCQHHARCNCPELLPSPVVFLLLTLAIHACSCIWLCLVGDADMAHLSTNTPGTHPVSCTAHATCMPCPAEQPCRKPHRLGLELHGRRPHEDAILRRQPHVQRAKRLLQLVLQGGRAAAGRARMEQASMSHMHFVMCHC